MSSATTPEVYFTSAPLPKPDHARLLTLLFGSTDDPARSILVVSAGGAMGASDTHADAGASADRSREATSLPASLPARPGSAPSEAVAS